LLNIDGMPGAVATTVRPQGEWDAPTRTPTLERFYRELMVVEKLPSPPEIAQRMLAAVNDEVADTRRLAALIARDQSLTIRLLRLANSAFFAVRTRVTSIQHAVTLLGFARVRELVLGLSVWGALGGGGAAGRRYRTRLWTHSATVAAAAKLLAERTGGDGPTAFTAGLLHDIGKLVLGIRLGNSYWEMLDDATERGETAAVVELESFQCHHGTVGGWLLQLWQLPPILADAVALHHEPLAGDYGLDLPLIVAIADRLVSASNPVSGEARREALDEVRAVAPGLLDANPWSELYSGLAREQGALAGIFGT
jgi:putative nucleotidyltransferase with HDIG domain